jgi:hypothetical protein
VDSPDDNRKRENEDELHTVTVTETWMMLTKTRTVTVQVAATDEKKAAKRAAPKAAEKASPKSKVRKTTRVVMDIVSDSEDQTGDPDDIIINDDAVEEDGGRDIDVDSDDDSEAGDPDDITIKDDVDNSPKKAKAKETCKPARMEVVNENASCKLVVTAGPYEGEVYFLGKGGSQSILFGTKPPRSKTIDVQALPLDRSMEPKHARLDWVGDKRGIMVKGTNKSTGGKTFIGDMRVQKDLVAFPGGSITIGDTILKVVQN